MEITLGKMGGTLVMSLVFFFCCARAAHANASYELAGTITYTGTRSNQFTKAFWVSSDSCRWSIITSNKLNGPNVGYCSTTFDGTNIHKVNHFANRERTNAFRLQDGKLNRRALTAPAQSTNKATLIISSNDMPPVDGDLIAPLWLALVSQCVLDNEGSSGLITPVWPTGNTPSKHHAEWLKSDREPHFPARVVYRNNGVIRVIDEVSNREVEVALGQPYQNGYTEAVLEVQGFKLAGDFEYPVGARLTQFGRKADAIHSGDLKVISVVDIVCESFHSGTGVLAAQPMPKNTLIVDDRLKLGSDGRKSTAFAYLSSNGVVVPPENVRTNPEYIKRQSAVSRQNRPKSTPKSGAVKFLFLGILLVSLGCVFFLTQAWKRKS